MVGKKAVWKVETMVGMKAETMVAKSVAKSVGRKALKRVD